MNLETENRTLLSRAADETGLNYLDCYQCGKCTAGCPLGEMMDYPVHQVIRFAQLGDEELEEKALRSRAIWICLSCETCSTRCPQEVEPAQYMDFLRHESYRRGMVNRDAARILNFHRNFLDSVKNSGRVSEIELITKMKTADAVRFDFRELMRDVHLAPRMFSKGKLPLSGETIKGTDEIARIYEKCLGDGG